MLALMIGSAFVLGLVARQCGLPPLVGFLAAGFLLNAAGVPKPPLLDDVSEAGILLLLFTVGMKLRIKQMLRPEVWGVALIHFAIVLGVAVLILRAGTGFSPALSLTLASVFGFSSTVLAAKVLEEKREVRAFHGRVAIGILIVQDIIAVAVLAVNSSQAPSPWALLLLPALPLMRPLLGRLLHLIGHGELLVLAGALLAIGLGGYGFHLLGLAPELGALAFGVILADHPRSVELSDALWGMKEFFLVGFFLGIGLTGLPAASALGVALLPVAVLPLKAALFFGLLLAFGLSARTGFLAGIVLSTYSEFGLIVTRAAVQQGLVGSEWLIASAIALALSFALAAPLNRYAHDLFGWLEPWLRRLERHRRHPDDEPISLGSAALVVVGMGRVGTGAYDHLRHLGHKVVGLDSDMTKVENHLHEGRRVVYADAEDPGLWHRISLDRVRVIVLALPEAEAKILASQRLRARGFQGLISATHVFPEERAPILAAGADVTYNYFTEAGVGLASDTLNALARPAAPAVVAD